MYHDEIRDLERVAALLDEARRVFETTYHARQPPPYDGVMGHKFDTELTTTTARCRQILHTLQFRERNAQRAVAIRSQRASTRELGLELVTWLRPFD